MKTTSRILAAVAAFTGLASVVACGAPPDGGESTGSTSQAATCLTCGTSPGTGSSGGTGSSSGSGGGIHLGNLEPQTAPPFPAASGFVETSLAPVSSTGATLLCSYAYFNANVTGDTYVAYCVDDAAVVAWAASGSVEGGYPEGDGPGPAPLGPPPFGGVLEYYVYITNEGESAQVASLPNAAPGYTYITFTLASEWFNPSGIGTLCSSGCPSGGPLPRQ